VGRWCRSRTTLNAKDDRNDTLSARYDKTVCALG
jgi:hypothetical protein